jgi:hypothetical protein
MISSTLALVFMTTALVGEANASGKAGFESLTSASSFVLDCKFQSTDLSGRLRLSAAGETQLLLIGATANERTECVMTAERLTQATALLVPRTSVHYLFPVDCRPAIPAKLRNRISESIELQLSRKGARLWLQKSEQAVKCESIRHDKLGLNRVVRELSRQTGTAAGAEKNL